MTTPREEQPQTRSPGTPTISTAPPRSRWRFGGVPAHLGRARTSTVVLSLLFVLVALLWLDVRPDPVQVTPSGGTTGAPAQEQPAPRTRTTAPTKEASTTAPSTSAPGSTTATRTATSSPLGTAVPGSATPPPGSAGTLSATATRTTGATGATPTAVVPTTTGAPTS